MTSPGAPVPAAAEPAVRCSPYHLALEADPVGTAGAYDGFLCVEVPLPWAQDISEHEPFASLGATDVLMGADGRRWRPQGLLPRGGTAGRVRVLAFDQVARPSAGPYRRREWWVAPDRVGALCAALVGADADVDAVAAHDADLVSVPDDVLDVFVCTHGRRDRCCGSMGTPLFEQLAVACADDPTVRLWRVSHTGGHKFAPTALTFPDGVAWAHLDLDAALAVIRRDAAVDQLVTHCRGASSLPPAGQVADRELLVRVGWDWLGTTRSVQVAERGGTSRRSDVRVDATAPDGTPVAAMVQVELDHEIPQPTCGDPADSGAPMAPVWRVARVDRIPAAQ